MISPKLPRTGPRSQSAHTRPARGKRRLSDPFKFDLGFLAEHSETAKEEDLRLAGVDEAGRGSLAGPLVAAAVVLDYASAPFPILRGLTDSKLLSPGVREDMYHKVLRSASRVSWSVYCPGTIDRQGLHRCNLGALSGLLESLRGEYVCAVVDGFELKRPELRAYSIVGADYKSAVVAAASVVAKVVRDRLMRTLALSHPEYGFEEHVGYATERHRDALRKYGPCGLHRRSFEGVDAPQLELWDE